LEGLTLFWQPRQVQSEFKPPKFEWMTSRDIPTSDSRKITRSLACALASRTNGTTDHTNADPVSQRASVRWTGVTFASANALRRAANIISQDPSFSAGAKAAAQNILRESEEGNARSVPPAAYSDTSSFNGQWTVYSGLCNNSKDESAASESNLTVPETVRTRRSTSTLPADRSRAPKGRHRHDDLARWLGQSPSSEREMTEGASSYPTEAFRTTCD
jgi:hypothetical protein